jgi:hypothetical protein
MNNSTKITRSEFHTYEVIRRSGFTNMFDAETVIKLSVVMDTAILTHDKVVEIMKHYKKYLNLYPLPKKGIIRIKKQ